MSRNFNTANVQADVVYAVPDPNGVRNVKCLKVERKESKDGTKSYLSVLFQQIGSGALATFTAFDVDPENKYTSIHEAARGDKQGRTAYARACDEQDSMLLHIFSGLTGIDYRAKGNEIKGVSSFEDYIDAYIATVDPEKVKAVAIDWIKLIWTTKADGTPNVTWPKYPPIFSTEFKPRDWNASVSRYDLEKQVFTKPASVVNTPDPAESEEGVSYEVNNQTEDATTEVDDDDELV